MDPTIYTLGDIEVFRIALQGVAMLFNPANSTLWNSWAPLGLGAVAGLGLLVTLGIVLLQAITQRQLRFDEILVLVIVYVAMFVPKVSVQLEDIYTGRVAIVDGVPAGIAWPGAVVSGVTYAIAQKMETAFSTTDGNYASLGAEGFGAPLKMMLALRRIALPRHDPYLTQSVLEAARNCAWEKPGSSFRRNKYLAAADKWKYLKENHPNAWTTYFNEANPLGVMISCDEAIPLIDLDLGELIVMPAQGNAAGLSVFETALNAAAGKKVGADPFGMQQYRNADLIQACDSVFAGTGFAPTRVLDCSAEFMKDALTQSLVVGGMGCGNRMDRDFDDCVVTMLQTMEQAGADAAGSAQVFVRTMVPTMNILMFLFFSFAPMMALVIMAMGMGGVKVAGKYLLFGVWTQTWVPTAAIINFFVQHQTRADVEAMVLGGDIQLFKLYELLSTKLMVANNMLAATPMITLALLTGSMYALTNLANRGQDRFPEKNLAPDLGQSKALAMRGPQYQMDATRGWGILGMERTQGTIQVGDDLTRQVNQTNAWSQTATKKWEDAWEAKVESRFGNQTSLENVKALGRSISAGNSETDRLIWGKAQEIAETMQKGGSQKQELVGAIAAELAFNPAALLMGTSKGLATALMKKVDGLSKDDADDIAGILKKHGGVHRGVSGNAKAEVSEYLRGKLVDEGKVREAMSQFDKLGKAAAEASAGLLGVLKDQYGETTGNEYADRFGNSERVSTDQTWTADLRKAMQADFRDGKTNAVSSQLGAGEAQALKESAVAAVQAQQSHSEAVGLQSRVGANYSLQIPDVAKAIARDGNAFSNFRDLAQHAFGADGVQRLWAHAADLDSLNSLAHQYGGDHMGQMKAFVAQALKAANQLAADPAGGPQSKAAQDLILSAVSATTDTPLRRPFAAPGDGSDLKKKAPDLNNDGVQRRVEAAQDGSEVKGRDPRAAQERIRGEMANREERLGSEADMRGAVQDQHIANRDANRQETAFRQGEMARKQQQEHRANMSKAVGIGHDGYGGTGGPGMAKQATEWTIAGLNAVSDGLGAVGGAAGAEVRGWLKQAEGAVRSDNKIDPGVIDKVRNGIASLLGKGAGEGGSWGGFLDKIHDQAYGYAKEKLGYTDAQAELHATLATQASARLLGVSPSDDGHVRDGVGGALKDLGETPADVIGQMSVTAGMLLGGDAPEEIRAKIQAVENEAGGGDDGRVIAAAVMQGARTQGDFYPSMVQRDNELTRTIGEADQRSGSGQGPAGGGGQGDSGPLTIRIHGNGGAGSPGYGSGMSPSGSGTIAGQGDGRQEGGAGTAASGAPSPRDQFVQDLWDGAQAAAERLGVKPEWLVAQAALETGWGGHVPLAEDGRSSNNLFGIKANQGWDGDQVGARTQEYEGGAMVSRDAQWRSYDSTGESVQDYANVVASDPRYQEAVANHDGDPQAYFKGLQEAGYATDPNYAEKVMGVLEGPSMRRALERVG